MKNSPEKETNDTSIIEKNREIDKLIEKVIYHLIKKTPNSESNDDVGKNIFYISL